jgi:hypothetical protein
MAHGRLASQPFREADFDHERGASALWPNARPRRFPARSSESRCGSSRRSTRYSPDLSSVSAIATSRIMPVLPTWPSAGTIARGRQLASTNRRTKSSNLGWSNSTTCRMAASEASATSSPRSTNRPDQSAEVTALTAITDEMVAGQRIEAAFVADAVIVIAHNAAFDRKFAERYWTIFERKSWGCSATEIEWRKHGFEGSRLGYLLNGAGFFHHAHRAVDDCHACLRFSRWNCRPWPAVLRSRTAGRPASANSSTNWSLQRATAAGRTAPAPPSAASISGWMAHQGDPAYAPTMSAAIRERMHRQVPNRKPLLPLRRGLRVTVLEANRNNRL